MNVISTGAWSQHYLEDKSLRVKDEDWEGGKFPWNPDEETEAQRGGMSCLKSHGSVGARLPPRAHCRVV